MLNEVRTAQSSTCLHDGSPPGVYHTALFHTVLIQLSPFVLLPPNRLQGYGERSACHLPSKYMSKKPGPEHPVFKHTDNGCKGQAVTQAFCRELQKQNQSISLQDGLSSTLE